MAKIVEYYSKSWYNKKEIINNTVELKRKDNFVKTMVVTN